MSLDEGLQDDKSKITQSLIQKCFDMFKDSNLTSF